MPSARLPGSVNAGRDGGPCLLVGGGALDKTDSQHLLTLGDTFILQLTKGKEKGIS